jgi:hypothetical protein
LDDTENPLPGPADNKKTRPTVSAAPSGFDFTNQKPSTISQESADRLREALRPLPRREISTERDLIADVTTVGMSDASIQHAFVSYVREDVDAVDRLVSVLQAESIPVWKDTESLWPGEDWRQKIREAIEGGSFAFIACFSTSSVQKIKTYMNAELYLAAEQIRLMRPDRVWLLPVRLDDCELPYFNLGGNRTLDSLQRIDLFGPKREANLARLVASVKRIFGTSTTT